MKNPETQIPRIREVAEFLGSYNLTIALAIAFVRAEAKRSNIKIGRIIKVACDNHLYPEWLMLVSLSTFKDYEW